MQRARALSSVSSESIAHVRFQCDLAKLAVEMIYTRHSEVHMIRTSCMGVIGGLGFMFEGLGMLTYDARGPQKVYWV